MRQSLVSRALRRAKVVGLLLLVAAGLCAAQIPVAEERVRGTVYRDENRNGTRDPDEEGIAGVCVSNGVEVVRTDGDGFYVLPARERKVLFVVKPSGYSAPLNVHNIPRFYFVHLGRRAPAAVRDYPGLAPSGEGTGRYDFPLHESGEERGFRAAVMADTQVTNHREIGYLRDTAVADVAGMDVAFAMTLGDNVAGPLSLAPRYLSVMSRMDVPTYYVPGNHHLRFEEGEGTGDEWAAYRWLLGPTYYSFNAGEVHFVVLNDVGYELGERQLTWLRNDVSHVPKDRLIVVAMHIPLMSWWDGVALRDREELYEILDGRRVLALSGHIHKVEHLVPGDRVPQGGTHGFFPGEDVITRSEPIPFPLVVPGAVCGSWWQGPRDLNGVPLSYQKQGAPKGLMTFEFDGASYAGRYRVSGKPADYQMNVSFERAGDDSELPAGVLTPEEAGEATVVVNFFCGHRGAPVSCSIDGRESVAMRRNVQATDPFSRRFTSDSRGPRNSSHLWTAPLPGDLEPGTHVLRVTAEDMYGQTHRGVKLFEVRAKAAVTD